MWFALAFFVAVLAWPVAALSVGVAVTLPDDLPRADYTLRVYAWPAGGGGPRLVSERPVKGVRTDLDLADGDYGIEVGGAHGPSVVLLRQSRFAVPKQTRVSLQAVRARCSARIKKADARTTALSLRRLGDGVETWQRDSGNDARPEAVVSPGESYAVSGVAESKDVVLALWQTVKVGKAPWSLAFSDADATCDVAAAVAEATPPLRTATVHFRFPETSVALTDAQKGRRLRTNRDRALVSYDMLTRAGESLRFTEQAVRLDRQPKLTIGGKLTAALFAAPVHREDGSQWKPFLVRRLYLCDARGRWADLSRSTFGFTCVMAHGKSPLPADASVEVPMTTDGFHSSDVTARVTYRYGGLPVEQKSAGTGFVEVKTPRVRLSAPVALLGRARRYARMVEVVAGIDKALCGRPGPASWQVDWRFNGNNAKSIVGGGNGGQSRIWGSYPYDSLERFADPFVEPDFGGNGDPFVAHELLHTFGYHHGDEMSKLEYAAEDAFRRLRWQAADTGVWPTWDDEDAAAAAGRTLP